jgi:TolA-binding protein
MVAIQKNKQLENFKLEHERNMSGYINSLKATQENSKDLYETQIKKLRSVLENLEHDLDMAKTERKLEANRLNETIRSLEGEIKHLKHLNHLEMQELKKTFDAQLHQERRSLERQREVENSNFTVAIKRLKNEVLDKNQEIEALSKRLSNNEELHSVELQNLKREK